jgi:hypothetical protein
MIELSPISSALSSLRAALNIVEQVAGLPDTALQPRLVELRSKLIDAESAAFADQDERVELLQRVHLLEQKVTELKARKSGRAE